MKRKHVYLEEWQIERAQARNINLSKLTRELLSAYFAYTDPDAAAKTVAEGRQERHRDELLGAIETVATIDPEQRDSSNPAIVNQAGKIEVSPMKLIELVEEYERTGEVPSL